MTALLIAYALNIIDYLITLRWVNLYGTEIEGNPLMRWAFENNVAWAVKIFGVGGLMSIVGACVYNKSEYQWTSYVLLVVYGFIVIYHLFLAMII